MIKRLLPTALHGLVNSFPVSFKSNFNITTQLQKCAPKGSGAPPTVRVASVTEYRARKTEHGYVSMAGNATSKLDRMYV